MGPSHSSADPTMSPTAGVPIVIPTYNEERGAGPTLRELLATLDGDLDPAIAVEVLVIDDGSTDGTAAAIQAVVDELGPDQRRLQLLRHRQNRGYGSSIKTGVMHARHPWILITDADGTYPNEHIPALLAERGDHEMVVGARTGAISEIPLIRRPPKWVLRKLASLLSGHPIPDLNSGLRVFRRDLAQRFEHILSDRFSYTTTITLSMFASGQRVKYVPINYLRREGASKIRPIKDTLGFLGKIVRTVLYFDPLRVFAPIAALFVGGAAVAAIAAFASAGALVDPVAVVLFVAGVQLLALGLVADMLIRRQR